jgi:Major Facilitator Superfamily
MTSLPDPSTDYADMRNGGARVAGEDGSGSRPSAVELTSTSTKATSSSSSAAHAADSERAYQTMSSELPPDEQFENEVVGDGGEDDEDDDDEMQSLAPSIASSVLTADGIHDMSGFYIVCLVILVGDMSRGVFFPSMWPLVDELGGTSVTLGYSVAAFSFGRILVSPLFGGWSVTYGYTKTLTFSCSILLLGTLLYAQVQNVGRTEFLIFCQCVLGLGSGTLGVTRAFIADVTAQRNRTTYMAWITAVQYAGFTVTPIFGALFNFTLQNVDVSWG